MEPESTSKAVAAATGGHWPPWELHAYDQRAEILEILRKPMEVRLTVELGPETLKVLASLLEDRRAVTLDLKAGKPEEQDFKSRKRKDL
jgi:hypothetical protein